MTSNLLAAKNKQAAIYLPLHVGELPAKILARRLDGFADLEIFNPNGTTMMLLSRIKLRPSKEVCGRGEAYFGRAAT